jgi:hypothetical protein
MKKKKLSKLAIKISNILREPIMEVKSDISFNEYMFSECGDDIKKKIRNMIFRLIGLRDQLSISISEKLISITSDRLKSPTNSKNVYSDYFSIEIIKDVGYIMNYKEKRLAYKDILIYDDLIEQIKITFSKLNDINFNEMYNDVMIDSGLVRDSNLDDLLS